MRWRRPELTAALVGLVAAALAVATAPVATAAPAARTQAASAGAVTATLSYTAEQPDDPNGPVDDAHLRVDRAGTTAFDQGIGTLCEECVFATASAYGPGAVTLRDLDGDGEPEVLVDAYSGGAHCCTTTGIYDYRPALGTYGHIQHAFGDQSYAVRDLDHDGHPEIVTADDSFAYAFTDYADSLYPPLVLRYVHAPPDVHLQDVTRRFPAVIRTAAAYAEHLLRGRNLEHRDLRGAVAAYVADEYLLGHGSVGRHEIAVQRRRGNLGDTSDGFWPGGRRFAPALLRFLHVNGYR